MNATLNDSPVHAPKSKCEFNILIFGMIAKAYGANSPSSPMRGWGGADANSNVLWEGNTYTVAPARKKGVMGCRLMVRNTDTREVLRDDFTPWSKLDRVEGYFEFEPYADL